MYFDRANEEDKKMVECWKGDAEGMLVFVSHQTIPLTSAYNLEVVDWSLLCCGRRITRIITPNYSA